MQEDPISKSPMEIPRATSETGSDHGRRSKPSSANSEKVLNCPRCDSLNTKFCYFNNYSLTQPRHFCKNCRRYWTQGGSLRNVPIGGGCRKSKRVRPRAVEPHDIFDAGLGKDKYHHSGFLQSIEGVGCNGPAAESYMPPISSASCFTQIMPPWLISDLVSSADNQYPLSMAISGLQQQSLRMTTSSRNPQQAVAGVMPNDATKHLVQQPQPPAALYNEDSALHNDMNNAYVRPEELHAFGRSEVTRPDLFEHPSATSSQAPLIGSSFTNGLASDFGDKHRQLCSNFAIPGTECGALPCGYEARLPDTHRRALVQHYDYERGQNAERLGLHLGSSQHHAVQIDPISYPSVAEAGINIDDRGSRSAPDQRITDLNLRHNPQLDRRGCAHGPDVQVIQEGAMMSATPSSWQHQVRSCNSHAAEQLHLAGFGATPCELDDRSVPTTAFAISAPVYSHEHAHVSFWIPTSLPAAWTSHHDSIL